MSAEKLRLIRVPHPHLHPCQNCWLRPGRVSLLRALRWAMRWLVPGPNAASARASAPARRRFPPVTISSSWPVGRSMGLNTPRWRRDFPPSVVNFSRLVPAETTIPAAPVAPRRDAATRALVAGVRGYQWAASPVLHALAGPGGGCRFSPTCSHYTIEALLTHGAWRGTFLATKRLLRCHPWGPHGSDPVPARF